MTWRSKFVGLDVHFSMTYCCRCPSAAIIVYIFWLGLNDRAAGFSVSPRWLVSPLTSWKWKPDTMPPHFSPKMRGMPRRAQWGAISGDGPDGGQKRSAMPYNSTTDRLPQWLVSMESPPPWILAEGTVPRPSDHVDAVNSATELSIYHIMFSYRSSRVV